MALITDLSVGDFIVGKVYTYHLNNVEKQYTNTYEFRANAIGIDGGDLADLASALADFHRRAHHTDVYIDRVVLSTREAEEGGYDPTSFVVYPKGVLGIRAISGDALAADIVLYIKRLVTTGRTGKLELRLCLGEGDINAPAGKLRLAAPDTIFDEYQDILGDSGLSAYMGGEGGSIFQMAMVSELGDPPVTVARYVQSLQVAGCRDTNPNHAYYNRA